MRQIERILVMTFTVLLLSVAAIQAQRPHREEGRQPQRPHRVENRQQRQKQDKDRQRYQQHQRRNDNRRAEKVQHRRQDRPQHEIKNPEQRQYRHDKGKKPGRGNSYTPPGNRRPPHPHDKYKHHGYRPPRPHGGHWGRPHYCKHYWSRPLPPPPPPRPVSFRVGLPVLNAILGINFGTFIDYSINDLYLAGYNVNGYADNAIYLTGVKQWGVKWPSVTIFCNNGVMSGANFQYYDPRNDMRKFNQVYHNFYNMYGYPVQEMMPNLYSRTVSWWDGSQNTYITLQYGPRSDGYGGFYTNLDIRQI